MKFVKKISTLWRSASPTLRRRFLIIFGFLLLLNIFVWIFALLGNLSHPLLIGLVILSYGLGLRHAVDADHIAAIDNTTRKLMQEGKKPLAVGFFFSFGHSTIVFVLCLLVAFSASFVNNNLPSFRETGSLIGTLVSSFFLLTIGIINLVAFLAIFNVWRKVTRGDKFDPHLLQDHTHNHGVLTRIFKPFLKVVDASWKMYFVGLLFGLGFDTASEIGLLSISAATGSMNMPTWYILLLPLAFTAGMSLIDTIDGVLMLGAYGWAYVKPVRKLYYNLNITFISVVIALFIGGVEALQLISSHLHLSGGIFTLANSLQFEYLGYIIIGVFVLSWVLSIAIYKMKRYDLIETTFTRK